MNLSPRRLPWALLLGLLLFVVTTLGVASYTLWRQRVDALASGLKVAAFQAYGFEDFLTQNLRISELAVDNLVSADSPSAELQLTESDLVATLRHSPFLRSMSLLDGSGRILVSSNPANVGLVVDTASYLPVASAQQELLRIGQPWARRDFSDGRATSSAEPVNSDEQSFIPVTITRHGAAPGLRVLLALNPDYFLGHWAELVVQDRGTVEILRYDGTLLMSTDLQARAGVLQPEVARRLAAGVAESGTYTHTDVQGQAQLTAFRASRLYPFVVVAHLDRDSVLVPWRAEVRTLLGILTPVLLLLVGLSIAFYSRQMALMKQRALSEQSAQAERLLRINAAVFVASSEAIVVTDSEANILSVNAAFTRIMGYSEQEVLGRNPRLWSSGQYDRAFYVGLWEQLNQTGMWRGELVNRRKDGSLFDAHLAISVSQDKQSSLRRYVGVISDITEKKQAREAREEVLNRFKKIASRVPGVLYQFRMRPDGTGSFPFVSEDISGLYRQRVSAADAQQDAGPVFALIHPDDRDGVMASIQQSAQQLTLWEQEYRIRFEDGIERWLHASAMPEREVDGAVLWYGYISDMTQRKLAEDKLMLAASVFGTAREGIMITDTAGAIIDVNQAFSLITGYGHDEVIGQNPRILKLGRQDKAFYGAMWRDLHDKGHWYGDVWNCRKNGDIYAEMLTISTVHDAHGKPRHYVAIFSDVTEAKQHEQQLQHIAHYDALTNLPNRVLLADRLSQSMLHCQRRGLKLAVLFLDLDGFKAINDNFGHDAGDHLLMVLANRMKLTLREGDTLARIGGDEFVAVLVDVANDTELLPTLSRLLGAVAEPMAFNDASLQVTASLGVTFYPQEFDIDADQLQRQADQAMYQAKLLGKNRFCVFDAEHDRSVRGHNENLEEIRDALGSGQLILHYQPKVNMRTGQLVGAEALIRWQHPTRGLLGPGLFLPVIETHALAVEVGEWVIHTALHQVQAWHAQGLDLAVSVNVGARQLQQRDFLGRLRAILAQHPTVPASQLELEVLETSALEDIGGVTHVIEQCRQMGVLFAIDDFGTGYSSLNYLKRLPVARIKIDQSFVRDMLDDADDLAILQGVIGLAHAFKREVIAEGVETVAHGRALLQLGCELAQGYGIAKPMPGPELLVWWARWQADATWTTALSQPPPVQRLAADITL
ncbi:MAG: EAL domain-containing protein [Rhodoferax sp.]|nr:EAL domain-containing protein [Rhodoferax sp.]